MAYHTPRGQKTLARFIAILKRKPATAVELGQALGMSNEIALRLITHLRTQTTRQVYIHAWLGGNDGRHTGNLAPQYAYGDAPDAVRPPKKNWAEVGRDRRARLKADPVAHFEFCQKTRLQRRRQRHEARLKKKGPATWLDALGMREAA